MGKQRKGGQEVLLESYRGELGNKTELGKSSIFRSLQNNTQEDKGGRGVLKPPFYFGGGSTIYI